MTPALILLWLQPAWRRLVPISPRYGLSLVDMVALVPLAGRVTAGSACVSPGELHRDVAVIRQSNLLYP